MAIAAFPAGASAAPPTPYSVDNPIKINVMGEWAHPDDDTSIIGPCGVWHQYFTNEDGSAVRCGIIMVTRGEGGGNAVGTEQYAALGLRRENEDRAAHYRSGTIDIFNIDRVDFFYNTSAPLTQFFWNHDETLRRVTRIIRETRPDVYLGFTPTLNAGHGNHQQAGRFIWEGSSAAADPAMFPEQLTGAHALSTWRVKKLFSGGSTAAGSGTQTASAANCTVGFNTAATNLDTVVGVWTGYASPYKWLAGNIANPANDGHSVSISTSSSGNPVTITTAADHGFVVGQPVIITGDSATVTTVSTGATAPLNGVYTVLAVLSPTTFTINPGNGTTASAGSGGTATAVDARAGANKTWAQVASEGASAYPTQSRTQQKNVIGPGCSRFGMTQSYVPFQPNSSAAAGQDDAILYGASKQDPGGLPLGTLEYLTFSRFFNVPGETFQVTLHVRSGNGTLPAGDVTLTVPAGWSVDSASKPVGPISASSESTVTFDVTPPANAAAQNYKVSALLSSGSDTGYTDNVIQVVGAAEGRWERIGKWAEYDQWVQGTAPQALRLGRATALHWMGVGETKVHNVLVHNWSTVPQSGSVTLSTVPAGFSADAISKPYGPLAPGASVSVPFTITNTDTSILNANTATPTNGGPTAGNTYTFTATTTWNTGTAAENLSMSFVPVTIINEETTAPTVDGTESPGEYTGETLNIGNIWEGGACSPVGVDCGTVGIPGSGNGTYARVSRVGDALYYYIRVVDDAQGYAPTPAECVSHWLADSVEILLDPRGHASDDALDTAHTFKLGIFPFSNDPNDTLGNGYPNGPCWTRDADAWQGRSNGALSIGNAPGVVVKSTAVWNGQNYLNPGAPYAGGGYSLEVKIPLAVLPAAVGPTSTPPTADATTNTVNPEYMGFNITPYDEDASDHVDRSTRMAYSRFGSVQSDPYRWAHAYLPGYVHPTGRSEAYATPIIPDSALQGEDSPETIAQAARDGVPFSGKAPAADSRKLSVSNVSLGSSTFEADLTAASAGKAHVFLYAGREEVIPVFLSSCPDDVNEELPGMNACAATDGPGAPWSPDMYGRLKGDQVVTFAAAGTRHVSITLTSAQVAALRAAGSLLIGWVPNVPTGTEPESQAFDIPLAVPSVTLTQDSTSTGTGDAVTFTATVTGTAGFPGTPTGLVQFRVDGADIGAPQPLDGSGVATLTVSDLDRGTHTITAVYLGDADYVRTTSNQLQHTVSGPSASFTVSPGVPRYAPVTVTFDAAASDYVGVPGGRIVSYHWDFGDGTTADDDDAVISHTYTAGGNFIVTLTVTDTDGNTATTTRQVDVRKFFWKMPTRGTPNMNHQIAGTSVAVFFTLSGDHGLAFFKAGWPKSYPISCTTGKPIPGGTSQSASSNGLKYDPVKDRYTFKWVTRTAWAGTCRDLEIALRGGPTYRIHVMFDSAAAQRP